MPPPPPFRQVPSFLGVAGMAGMGVGGGGGGEGGDGAGEGLPCSATLKKTYYLDALVRFAVLRARWRLLRFGHTRQLLQLRFVAMRCRVG